MPVHQIVVHSLGEFLDVVTPSEPDSRTGRRRDTGVYRGTKHARSPLFTSLDRLGGTEPPHSKSGLEEHVLRNFIRYSRPHLDQTRTHDEWELLIAAQHHGVPTRLLDWTYSPLVAAFFATRPSENGDDDRAVWRLDWQTLHKTYGLPPLALLIQDLESLFGASHLTPWKLFAARDVKPFACMIEPPALDARIAAQAATFTLTSTTNLSFEKFLAEQNLEHTLTRYVIPATNVAKFRDQLDMVGIDERRLFPDLDGVAAAIQRYYA
jgi:hypothetical protein